MVFLVKSNGKKYALKRMYVNNQQDLEACKLEIHIIVTIIYIKILKLIDQIGKILLKTKENVERKEPQDPSLRGLSHPTTERRDLRDPIAHQVLSIGRPHTAHERPVDAELAPIRARDLAHILRSM
jgi:hypothetical protein